jgi:predicted nucleotidyltransferase
MSLSRREQNRHDFPHRESVRFNSERLALALRDGAPSVLFAFLLGSAADGLVPRYSDLDVAVYLKPEDKSDWACISGVVKLVEDELGNKAEADVGVLNTAGVVFRREAIKSRLLFVRPEAEDAYVDFYTRTCQEYEDYNARLMRWQKRRRAAGLQA